MLREFGPLEATHVAIGITDSLLMVRVTNTAFPIDLYGLRECSAILCAHYNVCIASDGTSFITTYRATIQFVKAKTHMRSSRRRELQGGSKLSWRW
jgi:hypothetical protein